MNLMNAFDAAVTASLGEDALAWVKAHPLPKEKYDGTDYEAVWENQMLARYDYIPER